MTIKSDKWIIDQSEKNDLIKPFESSQVREIDGKKLFLMEFQVMAMMLGVQMNLKYLLTHTLR